MYFDDDDLVQFDALSIDDDSEYSHTSFGSRYTQISRLQESCKNVRREFFYQIFQWNPSWAFDNQYKDIPPPIIDSIEMNPTKLLYSTYAEYQKIYLPFLISEFWPTLRDDIIEEAKKKKEPQTITAAVKENSYEHLSLDNNDSIRKITRFKITATVPRLNKLEDKYPSRGDLVIIEHPDKKSQHFAYVEEVDRSGNRYCSQTTLTYILITKSCSQFELSGSLKLTTVTWILSYLTQIDSLDYILQSPLIESILKPNIDSYRILSTLNTVPIVTKEVLNSKQLEIISRVVTTVENSTPGICLIQGPPGTGKSTVIKNIIASTLSRRNTGRILVCAPSNKAIDELVMRLLDIQPDMEDQNIPFNIVRVGREDKIHKSVKKVSLLNLRKSRLGYGREQTIEESLLVSANIIACTLTSCYTSYRMKAVFGKNKLKIPFCIIDEAAQATELLTLVPLMFDIERLVLVGDPQQLPPTILSQKAKEYGYDESLFGRAQKVFESESIKPIVILDTQYRMVDAISQWPNNYFYKGAIKNAASVAPLNFCNYKVFNHSYCQDSDGHSNPIEAVLVANLVKVLLEKRKLIKSDKEISIGVITPYQKQRKLINQLLNPPEEKKILLKKGTESNDDLDKKNDDLDKENTGDKAGDCDDKKGKEDKNDNKEKKVDAVKPNKIEVNTVDSFQGSECDVIIMSCVRSNGIGFVKDPNRLCVSLTRAKHSLILCGNFSTFRINDMWQNLLDDAQSRGVYFNVSNDELKTITNHLVVDRTHALF
ncbi:probable helicase senataxin [Microplitis demolitor]|uniref:probable helicase senataxin n=1 Tax=Microplitis demolitor TaxID=69319 RepID=UPI0004CDCB8F|nr:probable helicase senataxin [Microplitis demolitor]XP_008543228.1 probable helicase senataxin [Microplitis demolitor]XP_008543229.1 probable helicase senataxin [Microplitis demolitor]